MGALVGRPTLGINAQKAVLSVICTITMTRSAERLPPKVAGRLAYREVAIALLGAAQVGSIPTATIFILLCLVFTYAEATSQYSTIGYVCI